MVIVHHPATAKGEEAPRLLVQMRRAIRVRHDSIRTEEVYIGGVNHFFRFHKRHPRELDADDLNRVRGLHDQDLADRQESRVPHLSPFLCNPSAHVGLRHPDHSGTPGPQGRQDDHDLHPRPEQLGGKRYRQPVGLASRPGRSTSMSTLTPVVLSTQTSTITTRSVSRRSHSVQVDLLEMSHTKSRRELTRRSNVSRQNASIASQS